MPFHPPFTTRLQRKPRPSTPKKAEEAKAAPPAHEPVSAPEPVEVVVSSPAPAPEPSPETAPAPEEEGSFPHWTARMRKAELLEVAAEVGLDELSMDNTKDEITDALRDAEEEASA